MMKKMHPIITCLTLWFATHSSVFSQPNEPILAAFDKFRATDFQEKIYVHTDRPFYLIGETMWIKIYCLEATTHRLSDVSKVAYIEIIDNDNTPLVQAKVPLDRGTGQGSIYLPATIATGNYQLRAYTTWMRNTGPEFFYHRPLSLINTLRDRVVPVAATTTNYDVQFFPEGGHLVNELESTMAYRVVDQTGKSFEFKGALLADQRDTVLRFSPHKFGIGKIKFRPESGHTYQVVITDNQKRKSVYNLPAASPQGMTMQVDDTDPLNIVVSVRGSSKEEVKIYLLAHTRKMLKSFQERILVDGFTRFQILKKDLGEGISHITLLSEKKEPLCERLYFTYPQPTKEIAISSDKPEFGTRKKVVLSLTSSNLKSSLNASLTVRRRDTNDPVGAGLASYLWLSSDLAGEIESPEYYLSKPDSTILRSIDNLMLTHGWRRFKWNDVFQPKPAKYFPELRGHLVQASVTSNGMPARGVSGYLSNPSRKANLTASISNEAGNLYFEQKDLVGQQRLIAQLKPQTDSSVYTITMKSPFSESFYAPSRTSVAIPAINEASLLSRSIGMQVQNQYRKEIAPKAVRKDSTSFFGKADEIYQLDDYVRFQTIEEVLREYVPSVFVRNKKDGYHFTIVDRINKGTLEGDPMVLLDGVPVFHLNTLMEFSPLKIKTLEVVGSRYFLGPVSLNGIVSFTTYEGDLADYPLNKDVVTIDYEGLQERREFYRPNYESAKTFNSRVPDQRYLLHWDPNVPLTGDKTEIEFYTSDVPGDFEVVVEGITGNGQPVFGTSTFTVKKN